MGAACAIADPVVHGHSWLHMCWSVQVCIACSPGETPQAVSHGVQAQTVKSAVQRARAFLTSHSDAAGQHLQPAATDLNKPPVNTALADLDRCLNQAQYTGEPNAAVACSAVIIAVGLCV